jgi:hypothetical protein
MSKEDCTELMSYSNYQIFFDFIACHWFMTFIFGHTEIVTEIGSWLGGNQ